MDSDTSIWANDARPTRIGFHQADALNIYANYYVVNGAVIGNSYGEAAMDAAATAVVQSLYPERAIELLNIDTLVGSHCCNRRSETRDKPVCITIHPRLCLQLQ